jgi:hypothetical protein
MRASWDWFLNQQTRERSVFIEQEPVGSRHWHVRPPKIEKHANSMPEKLTCNKDILQLLSIHYFNNQLFASRWTPFIPN